MNITRKMKKKTFAIVAAAPAKFPNPKMAAITAKTKNAKAHFSNILIKYC